MPIASKMTKYGHYYSKGVYIVWTSVESWVGILPGHYTGIILDTLKCATLYIEI